jgi:hypothetical protein
MVALGDLLVSLAGEDVDTSRHPTADDHRPVPLAPPSIPQPTLVRTILRGEQVEVRVQIIERRKSHAWARALAW